MIYFDNAATTRPTKECIDCYNTINEKQFFNPSANYSASFELYKEINKVRKDIISCLGGMEDDNLIFTSGATESNNIAIFGSCLHKQKKYLFSIGEHPSVYNCACELKNKGYNVEFIPLQKNGQIDYQKFQEMCTEDVCFVSTMFVNNETGAINDILKIRQIIDKNCRNAIFHVDAVQGFCKINFSVQQANINLCSISAHKIEGIKGVGALYISKNTKIKNVNFGGGQEFGLRSGTLNPAGIFSFNTSIKLALENKINNFNKVKELKNYLIKKLEDYLNNGKVHIVSQEENSPYIISLIFAGNRGETIMRYLDSKNIFISTGSACSSSKVGNRVLESMGYKKLDVLGSIRVSINQNNTKEEIDIFLENILKYIKEINT